MREIQRQDTGNAYNNHSCRTNPKTDNKPSDRHLCDREGGGLDH